MRPRIWLAFPVAGLFQLLTSSWPSCPHLHLLSHPSSFHLRTLPPPPGSPLTPALRMNPSPTPAPLPIFSFHHAPRTPLNTIATGCDADIGGLSSTDLTMVPLPLGAAREQPADSATTGSAEHPADPSDPANTSAAPSHMAFHGTLSLAVPPEYAGRIRTGYAAFRSKTRPTLFGEDTWNLELYTHLRVKVAYRGWEGWRSKFVCNLQTDGPVR